MEEANRVINVVLAKGGKQRRALVDGETVDRLIAHSAEHAIASDCPIFPLSTRHVYRIVHRYGPLISKDIHPHTLRYSFAINLVRTGMDIRRVQLLLGHANLNTTQVYLQFRDSDIREACDAVAF
ncbi:MAG: tyrosine-type recombinase/integrase [Halobacteriota archaeon]